LVSWVTVFGSVFVFAHSERGRGEDAPVAVAGAALLTIAFANDLLFAAWGVPTMVLSPFVFWLQGGCIGVTLLFRYQRAAAALAATEADLQRRTDELRRSYADLRAVSDELAHKQQLAAVGELAGTIAHEVRNPLAIIVNAIAGLRRRGVKDEDRDTLLGIVDEETVRLRRLVDDLLRFARPVRLNAAPVSLVELAERASGLGDASHPVDVTIADDPEIREVKGDPGLLWMVLENLVSNAVLAMPEGGPVSITVVRSQHGGQACMELCVSDRGVGMKREVLERAMDPFFTTRPTGTGLGLPITARIVEAHRGHIELRSMVGEGTTVSLRLPIGDGDLRRRTQESPMETQA